MLAGGKKEEPGRPRKRKFTAQRWKKTANGLADLLRRGIFNIAGGFLDLLAPPRCLCCDKRLGRQAPGLRGCRGGFELCQSCGRRLVLMGPACYRCGAPVAAAGALGAGSLRGGWSTLCGECELGLPAQDSVVCPLVYEGAGREIILAWKNSCEKAVLVFLVDLLARCGTCAIDSSGRAGLPVVCAIPRRPADHLLRAGAGGALLAEAFAARMGWPLGRLLRKRRRTPRQASLGRNARLVNLRGAFCIRRRVKIPEHVVIVDDVLTTGATVGECARVLKQAGARRVDVIAVARSV